MASASSPLRALAADSALRRVSVALGLYRLAEFGPWVAMLVYAYDQGGATATGVVSLGLLVPTALAAPFAGPAIDRLGASRVLVGAYGSQALALGTTAAALLLGAPPLAVYALGALAAMALVFTHPAHAVISPAVSRTTEQLVALNAVTGWILSIGLVVAPAVAGVLLAVASPGAVYAAGGLCALCSFLLVLPLRRLVPPLARAEADAATPPWQELARGGRDLARGGPSREVVLVLTATSVMVGAFDVLAVVLAVGVLDLGGPGAGYLTAAHGVGAVVGAVASLSLVGRSRLVPVLLAAALAGALAFLLLGLWTTVAVAFGAAVLTGVGRSFLEVAGQTLLQRVTPTDLLARAFAFKEGLAMGAWGVGSALVPLAIAVAGTTGALVLAGAVVPVVVLLRLRALLAVDSAVEVPVVQIALLRSIDAFRALPVPALEGVAHGAHDLNYAGGDVIVRQGDNGDRYYAIADGEVEVLRDGLPRRRLGRGDGFGEIALLHDGVRTATVVALDAVQVVAIDREPFLVAVTGHAETGSRIGAVAAERLDDRTAALPSRGGQGPSP